MGMGDEDVRLRFGEPMSARTIGGEDWLVYSADNWRLRLRLSAPRSGGHPVVRSCTLELGDGGSDLKRLLSRVGLAATGVIDSAPESGGALLRCETRLGGRPASVTANVRDGAIAAISVFDEAPDWPGWTAP